MRRPRNVPMLWLAWASFALAWVLPVHKEGVTLPEGLPGWQAFRVAAGAVWPYEGVDYDSWWGGALGSLSAATNVVMLGSLAARRRRQPVRRAMGIIALAAFVVNAQWLFLNTEWVDLRAGYYLWWLSFLVVGCVLLRNDAARGRAPVLNEQQEKAMGTPAILDGSNDAAALARLYLALCGASGVAYPQNRSQEQFVRAWELTGFLASDGFEWAFEQNRSAEELAAMLADVGFQEGAAFIRRAFSMVPQALLAPGQDELLFAHLRSDFEPFNALLNEYLRVADTLLLPALGNFVRQNRRDFEGVAA